MERTLDQPIKTSLMLFLRKGYKASKVVDILKVPSYSKAAFYHHFDSKISLLQQAVDEFFVLILSINYPKFRALTLEGFNKEIISKRTKINNEVNLRQVCSVNMDDMDRNFYDLLFDATGILTDYIKKPKIHLCNELTAWENSMDYLYKEIGNRNSKS